MSFKPDPTKSYIFTPGEAGGGILREAETAKLAAVFSESKPLPAWLMQAADGVSQLKDGRIAIPAVSSVHAKFGQSKPIPVPPAPKPATKAPNNSPAGSLLS